MLSDEEREIVRELFDPNYYRSTNPDIGGSNVDLFHHYVEKGWREGRDPSKTFSALYYLDINEDVAALGLNPLLHYIRNGRHENRVTAPEANNFDRDNLSNKPELNEASKPQSGEQVESARDSYPQLDGSADIDSLRPYFDFEFYKENCPNLEGDDNDLISHYLLHGWKQGLDPSPHFSTSYYLSAYPDIADGGHNPFLHYVLFGRGEGRRARGDGPQPLVQRIGAITQPHLSSITKSLRASIATVIPPARSRADSLDLHWIIPDFTRGSGGHMTIFRMIRYLENFGHRCHVWIERPVFHESGEDAWEDVVKYFQCIEARVDFVDNGLFDARGDAVIATGWTTAFLAHSATGFASKFYFVQDHEVEFYPTGADSLLARQSYGLGLNCICASPWLRQLMSERYRLWARHFHLAYDRDVYNVTRCITDPQHSTKSKTSPYKIAVYARSHTERRCVPVALMALELLAEHRNDFEVHFFGQERLPFTETPFRAYNHGVLGSEQLASLYNDCDIGICFSGTNYSLVPQEMMACGLPVLELDIDSTRAIFPEEVVTFGGPHPADVADKLSILMGDPDLRHRQAKAALEWVSSFSWERSAKIVESSILERLGEETALSAPQVSSSREVLLDVVIPTFNGIGELEPVIEALVNQACADQMQIYCIDSSSTDGTAEWLKRQREVSITSIKQSEFQHGRTRNFGASLGKAPIISFLTQDAMPSNSSWGSDILKMFRHVPEAAGLVGRHLPYPDHPYTVRLEIERHFSRMLDFPLKLSKETDAARWSSGDIGWRQFLHFYSDNNSAMRRKIWNDIPYPEIEYGEDQVWAASVIEAGHTKVYAPTVCVYHSHHFTPEETYKRARVEGAFFYEHFGYELAPRDIEKIAEVIENDRRGFLGWAARNGLGSDEIELQLSNISAKYRGWHDGQSLGPK